MVFLLWLPHLGKRFPSVIARIDHCDEFLMNRVAFRAFCRRNVRELPQIINYMPRIREYVERDEYKTQHRPGHLSPCPVVPVSAGPLQYPHGDQRSGASFLFLGIYYHETHKTSAKTARNIRATPPRKTPKTTASSLRFGLNVEPKESFASSGRSGS